MLPRSPARNTRRASRRRRSTSSPARRGRTESAKAKEGPGPGATDPVSHRRRQLDRKRADGERAETRVGHRQVSGEVLRRRDDVGDLQIAEQARIETGSFGPCPFWGWDRTPSRKPRLTRTVSSPSPPPSPATPYCGSAARRVLPEGYCRRRVGAAALGRVPSGLRPRNPSLRCGRRRFPNRSSRLRRASAASRKRPTRRAWRDGRHPENPGAAVRIWMSPSAPLKKAATG